MTGVNKAELRRLAEAATPGQWVTEDEDISIGGNVIGVYVAHEDGGRIGQAFANCLVPTDEKCRANAAFIAAANPAVVLSLLDECEKAESERARLNLIVNSPQSDDFLRAVSTEAEHQRQRWGSEHDSGKQPADWFWLVGYLAGKALHAHAAGDAVKAEHHVITTAAALANWHRAMFGNTNMRPGIDGAAAMSEEAPIA